MIKSLLLEISLDSQKHYQLLKGIVESMPKVDWKTKDVLDKMGEEQQEMDKYSEYITEKVKINQDNLPELLQKLSLIESQMGEEYEVLVQVKTLDFFAAELLAEYDLKPKNVQQIFKRIVSDEERHGEILANIRDIIHRKELELLAEDPLRKYRKIGVPRQ